MDAIANTHPPRRLPSLAAYLAVAVAALSILLAGLLMLVIERAASHDIATGIGVNLAELAGQTATRLDRGMFERYREVQLMANRLGRLKDLDEVRVELDETRDSYRYYAWLGVTDPAGVVQAASGGVLQGADVSQRPWFRQATQGIHLGDVHPAVLLAKALGNKGTDPPRFFDVAFPLQGGARSGVLGAHVSWEWARQISQAAFGPRNGTVDPLIISAAGEVLLGPPGTEGMKLALESVRRGRAGQIGYVIETWPDGREYVVGHATSRRYQSSPGLGWTVLVRQDTDGAFEPLRHLQWRVFFGGLTLAILVSALGWLAARRVTRPLQALTSAAHRLEIGAEDESAKVGPFTDYREVQVLGAAFNAMLARLEQRRAELHSLNTELEQRVEQRTREVRAAFDKVRANEHRIQTIIESAQDPFIGIDLDGHIIDWSSRAEAVFGWAREEVIGRTVSEVLLPERYTGSLEAALAQFRHTGESALLNRPIERVMQDRQGREMPVEVRIGLVSTGEQRFFSAFVHDISQRKEVERMKDEFISTVSHELRTPLTAIYGSLNLLTSGMAGELPPDAVHLLGISHQSTERLIRLINDMLDLEKIASGKIEYRMTDQPLRPLVEQAIRDTQAYGEGLKVRFTLEAGDHPRVYADADRIVQVCVNLLSNAAKFSPPDSGVEVEVKVQGRTARVAVIDHGPGVPPEFHERMFQRFAQADASDRRTKGGTGLGLSICRSIVEAHGGTLGFASEPGVRTEFYFDLPLVD
ncbi:ATP-binding protein [Ramlibacter sp. XY19]|uniref:sensor histidine kinase n=1 Tax=Ramlibacter paludis TaxID=2908000 RepID=UPI0023DC8AEA|nr:sensor histidine kinase [Ramlibacter paludis]MCG2594990.1 ATP-binding protein [Ramlibacter paludis]